MQKLINAQLNRKRPTLKYYGINCKYLLYMWAVKNNMGMNIFKISTFLIILSAFHLKKRCNMTIIVAKNKHSIQLPKKVY